MTTITAREIEILKLLADGLSQKEVETHFGMTQRSISVRLSRIRQKLLARSTGQALLFAERKGLLK